MVTKQQLREQITNVIQKGILTKVLPFTTTDEPPQIITAQNYQAIVRGGQIQEGTANEGEQTIIYQQDFQTAENEFNRFVDDITECYKDGNGNYNDFGSMVDGVFTPVAFGTSSENTGIYSSVSSNTTTNLNEAFLNVNLTSLIDGGTCNPLNLSLQDALISITQFQSLNLTSTTIDPNQAEEILDTTIFELITQQTTRQERINQFFQDYTNLRSSVLPTDNDGDGLADNNYDINNDISPQNPNGFIVRLNENAGSVNQDQTLEWLRNDLNNYFLDDTVNEQLPIYQERSSGYLKFREMNQAIIIRNTENQKVIPDTWIDDGFTITMWVKFKDKVSSGTLFNYGNPLRDSQPFGFMLETLVENDKRYLRLVVQDGDTTIDSHIGITNFPKINNLYDDVNQLINVPMDFNEWYFIVATFDTSFEQSESDNQNESEPLFWTGNLIFNTDNTTTQTHKSNLGNRCKVEIISKTDLLRARGYQT